MHMIHEGFAPASALPPFLVQQLAQLGSAVERAIRAAEAGDDEQKTQAFFRALAFIDLTIDDPRCKGHYWDFCRLRTIFCDVFWGDNVYGTSFEWLRRYFLEFAIAALSAAVRD